MLTDAGVAPTPKHRKLHKSWKLWSFYVDLVESVSSLEETKKVYERIFELRIATPQTVVNYANLLEEHKYFEESFKIYERGLDLFSYPVAFELWNLYLPNPVLRRIYLGPAPREPADFGSTMDGFPENTTETTLAVSSWLILVGELGSSTLES
ncbi:hypothetical protein C7999DRAFT_31039 [Corynascus novoguineensis]|uniref:Pre-mRNA-splicing factor Syf1/CRNKL1-like C-terminal HAT-repeats domain-containing protein n=1 Tax=Corynascus novoguineensis TaxID=1126955 RepID=A0AAN7CV85_9PEZI|nr:hypothetical protein C7999DRAFT_31039 [Corynascus novoguineensis]